ncbi:MAG: helix-turn-helix domain-containing protein [Bacteroidota bacterium]
MGLKGVIVCILFLPSTFVLAKNSIYLNAKGISGASPIFQDSIEWADYYYNIHRYKKAIPIYKKNLTDSLSNKTRVLKKLALSEAALGRPAASVSYINDYLLTDFDPSFLSNEGFDPIRDSSEFTEISDEVTPKITVWSFIYFFVSMIGFYVLLLICLNKNINLVARFLIAGFIFIHSLFILNVSINRAHFMFQYPHSYLISTWASFLYGPLLYLYFKRITEKYAFKRIDFLHLLPTIALLIFMLPNVYLISGEDKISLMLIRLKNGLSPQDSNQLLAIVLLKILSLVVYAYFIRRVYLRSKTQRLLQEKNQIWQKNIYLIHVLYILTYTAYGILIINGYSSGIFLNGSLAAMAIMVLYVGYSANIQPQVFSGVYAYTNRLFPKYEKSGLTASLSRELKENLVHLFANEKIYRENNINLEMVANRLDTTRHNASQVINEHFGMSFHEFVNTYRIEEAKKILQKDAAQKIHIIDVAYEVGYNNKVTFNKAFKKDTQLTPSEYQRNFKFNKVS